MGTVHVVVKDAGVLWRFSWGRGGGLYHVGGNSSILVFAGGGAIEFMSVVQLFVADNAVGIENRGHLVLCTDSTRNLYIYID